MSIRNALTIATVLISVAGCSTIASKTNMLSDDKIKSEAGGALGITPSQLTIVNRRTEGVNTYVQLKANTGREFNCIINGGNLLTMGMVTPPMCSKKGEPIKANPFAR